MAKRVVNKGVGVGFDGCGQGGVQGSVTLECIKVKEMVTNCFVSKLRYDRVEGFIKVVTDVREKVYHIDHEAIENEGETSKDTPEDEKNLDSSNGDHGDTIDREEVEVELLDTIRPIHPLRNTFFDRP